MSQQQQQQQSANVQPQVEAEETDKVVGYGAFGVVWSVTDPRSGRRVALKKMPNVFQTVVSAKRVFREVKMLCTLKHDNVSVCPCLEPIQTYASNKIQRFKYGFGFSIF